jgi:transcriptional regulator with PAS, ATPase and Fis domain
MRSAYAVLSRVGASDVTVLITGESGTGKELMARAVHDLSSHKAGPLVAFNCAAIAHTMLESELFGHAARCVHRCHQQSQGPLPAGRRAT